jgi:hypothetical protein
MKIKPTKRGMEIILVIQDEFRTDPRGAVQRASERLGISRQFVHQIFQRHQNYFPKTKPYMAEDHYFTCYVCGEQVPAELRSRVRTCCRDCEEQHLRKCGDCGVVYRKNNEKYPTSTCPECVVKRGMDYQKRMLANGGADRERILGQRRRYFRKYIHNMTEAEYREWRAQVNESTRKARERLTPEQYAALQQLWRERYRNLSPEKKKTSNITLNRKEIDDCE